MWYPYFLSLFQKTGHSRSSKRNTQYAPSLQTPGTGKAEHGFQRKGGTRHPVGPADPDGPCSSRQVSTSEQPRPSGSGGMDFAAVPSLQRRPSAPAPLLRGRSSPRRHAVPDGSVSRLENRRRICRQPVLQGSRTPMRQLSPAPPPPRRTTALSRPAAGTETGRIQRLRGDVSAPPPPAPPCINRILVH